jgi:hypothetical protein
MLRRRTSRAYTKRARERSRVATHIARAEKIARRAPRAKGATIIARTVRE